MDPRADPRMSAGCAVGAATANELTEARRPKRMVEARMVIAGD